MRMAEIPEQGAPGPGVHLIPAAEEALLLGDRQEQRRKRERAPHLPGVLPQGALPAEASSGSSVRRTSGNSRSASSRSGYYYNEARPSSSGPAWRKTRRSGFWKTRDWRRDPDPGNFLRYISYKESSRFRKSGYRTRNRNTVPETELEKEVTVDGINITGMSRDEAKAAILKDFPWGMKVTWQDQSYDVNDLMAEKVDSLLQEIYTGEPKESYTLDTAGLESCSKGSGNGCRSLE